MKLKFRNQDFQTDAMNAVADLFAGQEETARDSFANDTSTVNVYYILWVRALN